MNRSPIEIQEIVFKTIAETFNFPLSDISLQTVSADVDGWDSISNSLLYLALEERFETELPIERMLEAANVGDLCRIIGAAP